MFRSLQLYKISASAIAMCLLVGCNSDEYDKVREENTKLVSELRLLKEQLYELESKKQKAALLVRETEFVQRKEKEAKIAITDIDEYHSALKSALDYSTALSDSWKTATRKSLIGERLGLLRVDGVTFSNTEIVKLNSEVVTLKHDKGEEEFKLADLPEPARKQLIHEPTILLESKIVN